MSNEGESLPRVSLRPDVADVLSGTESALHERVVHRRDQALAHSDAIAHEIRGVDYSGKSMMFYKEAFDPLTKDETQVLRRMIKKWIGHLEELRARARQSNRSSFHEGTNNR